MIERNDGKRLPRWNIIIHLAFVAKRDRETERQKSRILVTKRELFIRTLYSRAPVVSMTHISVGLEAILFVFRCVWVCVRCELR